MNEIGRKIVDKLIELHGAKDFMIAFLPYKRSMWSSMESVYEECIKSGIDAHVYPIPYYRMKADGTPDYIDSDFEYFDNAEPIEDLVNPDYIVIHYFYDDHNRVTNMLPEYYTKALKDKYKCKIIMLPYAMRVDITGNTLYPAFFDVDYIFTTEVEDWFIEDWKKVGVDFTNRIFTLGSPKYDTARSMIGKKIIPEEWQKIKDKQVTLILNSLIPYLNNPYKRILDYLCYAIQELSRQHAVIFRPHPLMRTTVKTMTPECEVYYDFLLQEFTALGVIVDESEYLERAMMAADYLIGDSSSVIYMWQETGKPYKVIE